MEVCFEKKKTVLFFAWNLDVPFGEQTWLENPPFMDDSCNFFPHFIGFVCWSLLVNILSQVPLMACWVSMDDSICALKTERWIQRCWEGGEVTTGSDYFTQSFWLENVWDNGCKIVSGFNMIQPDLDLHRQCKFLGSTIGSEEKHR